MPAIDLVERVLLAGGVTYVGAHGRRRTWLLVGGLVALPSSGTSLALVLVGLGVAVWSATRPRRSRRFGAVAVGCFVNAILWYPAHEPPWGVAVGIVAMIALVVSGTPYLRASKRRAVQVSAIAIGSFALVASAMAAVAVLLASADVRSGSDEAKAALEAARDGDGAVAAASLQRAGTSFDDAAARLSGVLAAPAQVVPGVAQQLDAVQTTVDQGRSITAVGDDLVRTADYDRLQYDGRLDLQQIRALQAPTERADDALATADDALRELQQGSLLPPLRTGIDRFADEIDQARRDTAVARSLITTVPQLFGADGERRYLVIFTTPAELRGAGGFIGSYAELLAADGEVSLVRSGRIDDLIEAAPRGARTLSGPDDYVARYGQFQPQDFPQDATLSPNFPSSAEVIAALYPQSGGTEVDGVINADPAGLAALLALTGPIDVEGLDEPLTSENATDLLLRRQYLELGDRAERGEFQAEAFRATFDALVSSSLPAPRTLASTLSPAARGGHLRMWSPDPQEQALFEQLGADGSLAIPEGTDGFSVVQRNVGNNKIDAYLRRTISYDTTVDAATGDLAATLRIELTNDVPQGVALPAAVGDNTRAAPPGTNVTVVTIHTPHVVRSATLDGEPIVLGPGTERDLRAWDTPDLAIPPGETVVLEVELDGGVDLRDGYHLLVLPQPVANPDVLAANLAISGGVDAATGDDAVVLYGPAPMTRPVEATVEVDR